MSERDEKGALQNGYEQVIEELEEQAAGIARLRAEEARYGASQWQLMWRKFIRNRAAIAGGVVLLCFYLSALFAGFLAPYTVDERFARYVPPQRIHLFDNGRFRPFIYRLQRKIDMETLRVSYEPIPDQRIPVKLFVRGKPYKLFGLIRTDIHLFGVEDKEMGVFLLGTDRQGRDMLSRILIGSQISLTVGLVGVFLSLFFGTTLGVASGYYGGVIDNLIQRLIELVRSFPSIPLWMALAAALPPNWPPLRTYFAITLILSVIGWTWLARQLRGKVLALREEEFVLAAEMAGASDARVIFRHLVPAVLGHIIVIATMAMPNMILAETALSYLGLGIRPPLTSWGLLLQEVQNLESIAQFAWVLLPAAFISAAVLAFNFVGDGLRDASDPYSL